MALLRQFGLVLALSCLTVLAQSGHYQEASQSNDGELSSLIPSLAKSLDFLNWKTTTPKPRREPEHTKPVYITYRPPKGKPSYPYPYYPEYYYPQQPHQYWPHPELPTPKPHPGDHGHVPYHPQYPSHGHRYPYHPYFIVINLPPHHHNHHHPEPNVTFSVTPEVRISAEDIEKRNWVNQKHVLTNPIYIDNENEPGIIEAEYDDDEPDRNFSLDGFNISADSSKSDDTETVDTKDVKLPLDFILGQHSARKWLAQQEAFLYLRNYKKGRQLKE